MMELTLSNQWISLKLAPHYGARVTDLIDRVTGRQWLVQGDRSSANDDDAIYGADESRGWDECFPTVAPCEDVRWGGRLRDHGMLWGRPWVVVQASDDVIETQFLTTKFRFARTLKLNGGKIFADYAVTNTSDSAFPYLWSQHCLLATTPDDIIALSGLTDMRANHQTYDWPNFQSRDLSKIGPSSEGFALKSYACAREGAVAEVFDSQGGIRFEMVGVPAFGLWLSYGGWPKENPVHQVALEPTTAMADDLQSAEKIGHARHLFPHATDRWSVCLTMTNFTEKHIQ